MDIDLRERADEHLRKAKALLDDKSEAGLRYACLELRMAIECLSYDLLKLYRNDVSDDLLEEYRANVVLAELKRIDPFADGAITLLINVDDQGNETPETFVWKEHRLTAKWATKAYNTLGRFLHERTFLELEQGRDDRVAVIRSRAEAISREIEKVLSGTGWRLRARMTVQFECTCGGTCSFDMSPQQVRSRARCDRCDEQLWVERDAEPPHQIRCTSIEQKKRKRG